VGKIFSLWLAATRPAFLSVTFVGVLLGLATASYNGTFHSVWLAALTMIFALVAHAGANVLNDYYDALSGCDAANTDRIFPFTGGSRFIQDGLLSTKQTAVFGYALLIAVIPAGLYLIAESGSGLLVIGLCGLFAGWAYSAKPFALQSRGIGEFTITIAWMMIVIGSDYVQRGAFALTPAIAGLAYALLVSNILFINQIPDRFADAIAGKRTLIVRFDAHISPWVSLTLFFSAFLVLVCAVALSALPPTSLLAFTAILPASKVVYILFRNPTDPQLLKIAIPKTIQCCLIFGLMVTAGLIL